MDEVGMEHRLTVVERSVGQTAERLEVLERRQDDLDQLVASVAVFAKEQEHIQADVREIKADVKRISAKPGKRFDAIVDKVVWMVLAAVIAFLLARIGL